MHNAESMRKAGPSPGRRVRAYAYALVTTAIVLLFALAEWGAEKLISERSRAAGTVVEIAIVLAATLAFRPIHQRVEAWVEREFNRRKHQALAAIAKFRHELTSFSDLGQLLHRVIEAVDQHMEARACAVYVRLDAYHAEASSYDRAAEDLAPEDPLLVRLRSSGKPAQPPLLKSSAPGTHAFPMTAGGELIGFLAVDSIHNDYDAEELHMLSGLASDLAVALVALDPRLRRRVTRRPNNLPAELAPLIGRERELGEIGAALQQSRLVTLTGPGGVGKTRLALHCAASALDAHTDGAWFIDLAPIANGSLVAATMLAAFDGGPAEAGTESARLLEHLRPRDALVVVDNCEHLASGVAPLVARVLAGCPHVRILCTSRELLHLDGERVYRIGPLAPNAAADLFTARAVAVSPLFDAQAHQLAIRAICEQLDGVPLAIELAAARVRALSVEEILTHLDERFRLLTSGSHTALPRQQTLAATIEWSYELLNREEQRLFGRLGSFCGSFSLAAAAAVCGEGDACDEFHVVDVLTSLADKSLLTVTIALTTRYRMLETIRAFAGQKAIENQAAAIASQQHAAFFANLAAEAYRQFDTRQPEGWLERLSPDIDNFRAALAWTLEGPGDRSIGAQLAADCGAIFLRLELLAEGLRWCAVARKVVEHATACIGRIDYVASMMQTNLGQEEAALGSVQRAVECYKSSQDRRGLIRALSQEAQLLSRAHRFTDAVAPAEEAISGARAFGEPRLLATVLRRCAFSLPPAARERARPLFEEALEIARSMNERDEIFRTLCWWAACESLERATGLYREALEYAKERDRITLEANLAGCELALGRPHHAEPHAEQAARLALSSNRETDCARAVAYWAPFRSRIHAEEAAILFGYATAKLQRLNWSREEDDQHALDAAKQTIEGALPQGAFTGLASKGAALNDQAALAMLQIALAGSNAVGLHAPVAAGDRVGTLLR